MLSLIKIAFRNTRRQMKRSVLLGGAIAFGIMIITLLNAFTAGVVGNIKGNFSYAFGGHIFVSGSELTESDRVVGRIGDDDRIRTVLDQSDPRVASIHRRSRALATIIFGSKQVMERIDGVDFAEEKDLSKGLSVNSGSLASLEETPRAIVLPAPSARKLGVHAGEKVLVRLQTVTGQQNVGEFKVVAIIEDTSNFGMSTSYASLTYLNELLGLKPDEYQLLTVFLKELKYIDPVADELYDGLAAQGAPVERPLSNFSMGEDMDEQGQEAFGALFGQVNPSAKGEPWQGTKFEITTLNEMMQPVVSAMRILDGISLGIFLILLLITMVGIMNTFRMILIERTREIGTMRAFGMQRNVVRRIFLWEAAFVSLGGSVVGMVLAAIIAAVLAQLSFDQVQGLQFFLNQGHFTLTLTPAHLLGNVLILMVMSLSAAFLPANAAAKLQPVKALGAHY